MGKACRTIRQYLVLLRDSCFNDPNFDNALCFGGVEMISVHEQYQKLIDEIKKHGKLPPGLKKYVDDAIKTIKSKAPQLPQDVEEDLEYIIRKHNVICKEDMLFNLSINTIKQALQDGQFYRDKYNAKVKEHKRDITEYEQRIKELEVKEQYFDRLIEQHQKYYAEKLHQQGFATKCDAIMYEYKMGEKENER
jgi:polyhydroxyalkanoate synthesis regulator phasin